MQRVMQRIPQTLTWRINARWISTSALKNAEVEKPKMAPAAVMGGDGKNPINTVLRVRIPASRFMQTSSNSLAKPAGGKGGKGRGPCGGFTKLPSDDMILDIPVAIKFRMNVRLEEYEVTVTKPC